MKKRLITILSLVMAVVLCFSLAACGGDKSKQPSPYKTVSVSVNDAVGAAEAVLNAKGFTGTASYTLSTKNTQAITQSGTFDKRGNKIKFTAGEDETIVDLQTGYVYYKYGDYYAFDNEFYANEYAYVQYLIAGLKDQAVDQKIDVRYNEKKKTVTFELDRAADVNKYLAPLQKMYKKEKYKIGDLLDEYCNMLLGKDFDDVYSAVEDYVSDPKNTVGGLLNLLKGKGLDVEAILESFGYSFPAEQMTAIKARPLNKVVAGTFKFVMNNFGEMLPFAEEDSDDVEADDPDSEQGGGMQSFAMGLINAMLFEEVSEDEIATAIKSMSDTVTLGKNTFTVKSVVDMALKDNEKAADLYTVIKDGVKLTKATTTITLTVGANKTIKGVKVDCYAAHNYKGVAAEDSFLADNDYRATAEIKIDEYTTPTEDFVITFDPACDYKMPIVSLLYNVTDNDVSVYYETGGKTVNMTSYSLYTQPLNGEITPLTDVAANAFKFDAATSSFVFDGALVKSALTGAEFGDSLYAVVYFDDDDYSGYGIALSYVNDDWNDIFDYLRNSAMDRIMDFVGGAGSDAPNVSDKEVA